MSDEKKKLSDLSGDAIDGEKIKGGAFSFAGGNRLGADISLGVQGDPNPNAQPEPGVDYMPEDLPGGISNLPGDNMPKMDDGLIMPKNPNASKI